MAESEFSSVYGDSRFLSFVNSKLLLELTSFSFALTNTTRDLCFLLFCPNFPSNYPNQSIGVNFFLSRMFLTSYVM